MTGKKTSAENCGINENAHTENKSQGLLRLATVPDFRLSKKSLGGIGGLQPSDCQSETSGVYGGFGTLA